jgi:hypothetical protein
VAFPASKFGAIQKTLTSRFGGTTAFFRVPAEGLWEEDTGIVCRDKIVIVEVVVDILEPGWWDQFRKMLEKEFAQESIQILAQEVQKL